MGTYIEEPNERELATECSPNNKPVLSSLGLPEQEENTHLWVCQVCEAPALSQMMGLLSSFLQELDCKPVVKKDRIIFLVYPTDLKHSQFAKWLFKRGKKGLFTTSLKMF